MEGERLAGGAERVEQGWGKENEMKSIKRIDEMEFLCGREASGL